MNDRHIEVCNCDGGLQRDRCNGGESSGVTCNGERQRQRWLKDIDKCNAKERESSEKRDTV